MCYKRDTWRNLEFSLSKTSIDILLPKLLDFQHPSSSEFQTGFCVHGWSLKLGDDLVPMPESMDRWLLSKILQDGFFDKEHVSGTSAFKRAYEG